MARTELTVYETNRTTSSTTISDVLIPTDGVKFKNDGKIKLLLRNINNGVDTVTIQTGGTSDGLAITDLTVAMADGSATNQVVIKGPFPLSPYNQTDGYVYVDASVADKVYAYAFRDKTS